MLKCGKNIPHHLETRPSCSTRTAMGMNEADLGLAEVTDCENLMASGRLCQTYICSRALDCLLIRGDLRRPSPM